MSLSLIFNFSDGKSESDQSGLQPSGVYFKKYGIVDRMDAKIFTYLHCNYNDSVIYM